MLLLGETPTRLEALNERKAPSRMCWKRLSILSPPCLRVSRPKMPFAIFSREYFEKLALVKRRSGPGGKTPPVNDKESVQSTDFLTQPSDVLRSLA